MKKIRITKKQKIITVLGIPLGVGIIYGIIKWFSKKKEEQEDAAIQAQRELEAREREILEQQRIRELEAQRLRDLEIKREQEAAAAEEKRLMEIEELSPIIETSPTQKAQYEKTCVDIGLGVWAKNINLEPLIGINEIGNIASYATTITGDEAIEFAKNVSGRNVSYSFDKYNVAVEGIVVHSETYGTGTIRADGVIRINDDQAKLLVDAGVPERTEINYVGKLCY